MENKSKLNTILLVIIIILLVGGGLVYLFLDKSKQNNNSDLVNKLINQEQTIPVIPEVNFPQNNQPTILPGYSTYSGNAPFTFTYPLNLFKPDLYNTNSGSKTLSIESSSSSSSEGCDMIGISTLEMNKIPVCYDEFNRYTSGVMNYCKTVIGIVTGTTYKVDASTPQVCGKPASQTARNFVDHLIVELSKQ